MCKTTCNVNTIKKCPCTHETLKNVIFSIKDNYLDAIKELWQ